MTLAELERMESGVLLSGGCKCARSYELCKRVLHPNTDKQEAQYFFKFYGIGDDDPPTHFIETEEALTLLNNSTRLKDAVDEISEEIYNQYR